jgi:hypothetical protein
MPAVSFAGGRDMEFKDEFRSSGKLGTHRKILCFILQTAGHHWCVAPGLQDKGA